MRAFSEAVHGAHGPGPVHLNLEFREPLTGEPDPLPPSPGPSFTPLAERTDEAGSTPGLSVPLSGRGMIVVGATTAERLDPSRVLALGERLGWPVLADPLSGCRVRGTIGAADAIVRSGPPLPDCVVLLGTPWLSRALGAYVSEAAGAGARIIVVDPFGHWADPLRVATEFHASHLDTWLARALRDAQGCEPAWLAGWQAREARAQRALADVLGARARASPWLPGTYTTGRRARAPR